MTIVDMFQREGNTREALTILSEAVADRPDNPYLLYRLGILQARAGMKDQCKQTFTRALDRAPHHPDAGYARKFLHIQSLKDNLGFLSGN